MVHTIFGSMEEALQWVTIIIIMCFYFIFKLGIDKCLQKLEIFS